MSHSNTFCWYLRDIALRTNNTCERFQNSLQNACILECVESGINIWIYQRNLSLVQYRRFVKIDVAQHLDPSVHSKCSLGSRSILCRMPPPCTSIWISIFPLVFCYLEKQSFCAKAGNLKNSCTSNFSNTMLLWSRVAQHYTLRAGSAASVPFALWLLVFGSISICNF